MFLGRAPADGYVPHVPFGVCNVINRIHAFLSFLLGVEVCWAPSVTPSGCCSTQLLRARVCARIGSWGRLDTVPVGVSLRAVVPCSSCPSGALAWSGRSSRSD